MLGGDLCVILYADVLFIIDFSMDVISLWITGRITHSKMKPSRISISAAIGALLSVLCTAFSAGSIISALVSIVSSVLMCIVSFSIGDLLRFLRRLSVVWVSGMLLGGIMTSLMSLGNKNTNIAYSASEAHTFSLVPIAVVILLVLVGSLMKVRGKREVEVILKLGRKSVNLRGLADSGNLLEDPFSGDAVIVAFWSKVSSLFENDEKRYLEDIVSGEIPLSLVGRVRFISAAGIGGQVMLKAVRFDKVIIDSKECRTLIALDMGVEEHKNYDCIVPFRIL